MVFVFVVFGSCLLFSLGGCIYYVWLLYLLGHSEHGIAVLDEIVKGGLYGNTLRWVYTAYVHVTYQGEPFRGKMKFSVQQRIVGFALDYEIPVTISRSKRGKMRVFQKGKRDKVAFVFLAVILGIIALLHGLIICLALSAILSH